jgi:hypothetical protein
MQLKITYYVIIYCLYEMKLRSVWRMPSSGMWRRVDISLTDVSEERIATIFKI